jgi:hypothetical protein
MSGPRFSDDSYYEDFNERSFIASTGANKMVFNKLCELADIGKSFSPFKLKFLTFAAFS